MDPTVQALMVQLSSVVARSAAGTVADRIRVAKSKKKDDQTIRELEDIISEVLDERQQLVQISQGLSEALASQRISKDEIDYIVGTVIPLIEKFMGTDGAGPTDGADEDGAHATDSSQQLEALKALISVETLTIMQLIGFNYKEAIGRPLTDIVQTYLLSQAGMLALPAGAEVGDADE